MSNDTAQNTAAGISATSGSPVQGMTGGVPLPISATVLPLPTGAAADGTDGTGITQPTGGAGIRGWLSGIFSALGTLNTTASGPIPAGTAQIGFIYLSTPASETSTVANTATSASIPAVVSQYSYLSGLFIAGLGATSAGVAACSITNVLTSNAGSNTWNFNVIVPAGVTVPLNSGLPIMMRFERDLQAKAINTAITVNVAAFGSGNTQAVVGVWGYTSPNAFAMP